MLGESTDTIPLSVERGVGALEDGCGIDIARGGIGRGGDITAGGGTDGLVCSGFLGVTIAYGTLVHNIIEYNMFIAACYFEW